MWVLETEPSFSKERQVLLIIESSLQPQSISQSRLEIYDLIIYDLI